MSRSGHQLVSPSLFELYHQPPALGKLSVRRRQLWHLQTLAGKPPRKDRLRYIDLQSMLALSDLPLDIRNRLHTGIKNTA